MENTLLIGIAALIVGALIGYLMGRSGGGSNQAALAEQLNDARTELDNYKQEVEKHFAGTAELVNNLTNSYKDVHQHLANGAQNLCQSETMSIDLASAMQPKLENSSNETANEEAATAATTDTPSQETEVETAEVPEPPRDYAPKSPDEAGTLSEGYGLKDETTDPADIEQPNADSPEAQKEKNT